MDQNEQHQENNDNGPSQMKISKSGEDLAREHLNEEKEANELRHNIQTWIGEHPFLDLELKLVSDFVLEFTIGPTKMAFQVGTDAQWRPMFLTSSAPLLADYLTPVNAWIDENSARPSFSVLELLDFLGQQFREFQKNVESGTIGVEMQKKVAEELERLMKQKFPLENVEKRRKQPVAAEGAAEGDNGEANFDELRNSNEADGDEEGRIPTPPPPQRPPVQHVQATPELFEQEIYPSVRRYLEGEHMAPFEVEEWIRRVQQAVGRNRIDEALRIVKDEALGGAQLPEELEKFYAPAEPLLQQFERAHRDRFRIHYIRDGLSAEAAERLEAEAEGLRETNASRVLGFVAAPCANALAHWNVTLLGESFDPDSSLGMQLIEWTMNHGQSNSNVVRPADVQIEMLMPVDFPNRGPIFRLIAPRFKDVHRLNQSLSQSQHTGQTDLTFSRDLESDGGVWDPSRTIPELIADLRARLEGAEVDLEAGKDGSLATLGGFWRTYLCMSPSIFGKPEQEHTGKITLPSSALEHLFNQQNHYLGGGFGRRHLHNSGQGGGGGGPMTFEISTNGGRRSFCGVGEFTAEEGCVVVPDWMAKNLGLRMGEEVHVRRVYVPKGLYMKLQPHDARYAKVGDTKRMLEWVLRHYTAVATGDTLVINYFGEEHKFDILDVSPGRAIQLTDCDVAVDFVAPLSGETVPRVMDNVDDDNNNNNNAAPTPANTEPSTAAPAVAPTPGQALGVVEGEEGKDWKRCPNCRRGIPIATFDRHTLQCHRLNWYCEVCNVSVEKRKQDEHMQEMHSTVFCDCGFECEARELDNHKAVNCPLRIRECMFCHLRMPHHQLWAHEKECGSKTEKCDKCGLYVQIRDLVGHADVCGIPDRAVPPRNPYRYDAAAPVAPRRPAMEDLFVCPHCSQPCEQLDDLQVHILVTHPDEQPVDFMGGSMSGDVVIPAAKLEEAVEGFKFDPPSEDFQFKMDEKKDEENK